MIKKVGIILLLLSVVTALAVSCRRSTKEKGEDNGPEAPAKPRYVSKQDEGTVTGKINFTGDPPAPTKLDMNAEPSCASKNPNATAEDVIVSNGKLANVFVYVKGGPASRFTFDAPSDSVNLDQNGCRYIPHVLGLQVKQTLSITNSDPASHNIHPKPKSNREWNESQPPGTGAKDKTFAREEVLIPVKCDIHPWMKAYIGVLGHPFYAVSGQDGSFTIGNVPPGDYTLVVWHEKYGEKTEKITVPAKGSVTKDFTYQATAAYVPPTHLKVEAALILP